MKLWVGVYAFFLSFFLAFTSMAQTIGVGWPSQYVGFSKTKINGNTFFYTTSSNWDKNYKAKFVKFEVTTSRAGFYQLAANVLAPNGGDNSFYVVVNKRFPYLWHIPVASTPRYQSIDNRIYLKAGANEVIFYPRENHTKVADVRAIFSAPITPSYQESFSGSAPAGMFNRAENRDGLWITGWDSLKATYRPTSVGSPRLLWKAPVAKGLEYTLTYKVKFKEGFDFARGGKLHGMGPDAPTTGCNPRTDTGWSNRLMFGTGGSAFLYIYHQNRPRACGHGFSSGNTFRFQPGRWYTVSIYTKLNSSGSRSDGVAKLYINGQQLVEVTDLKYRNSTANSSKVSQFLFSTFFGGNSSDYSPRETVSAYFDDFQMVMGDYPR